MSEKESHRTRGSQGIDKSTPEYQEYKEYLNRLGTCNIREILSTMKASKIEIEKKSGKDINDLINGFMEINMSGGGKIRGGGIGIPISSVYLIEILKELKKREDTILEQSTTGIAFIRSVYDRLYSVLEKGLALLQFLSNKNSCLENFLKYLLGDNITKLIEYYLIGTIFMNTNPLELVNVLQSILIMIKPTIIPLIGGTVSIIIGKYVSAISKYYLEKGHNTGKNKLIELQTKVNDFVNMSDKDAVKNIKKAANELHTLIETELQPIPIMTEEDKEDFMDEVEEGLTQEQRDLLTKVGELSNAKSVGEMYQERQEEGTKKRKRGGKRHRKTKKHHKKSQKKYRKKSHKRHHKKK